MPNGTKDNSGAAAQPACGGGPRSVTTPPSSTALNRRREKGCTQTEAAAGAISDLDDGFFSTAPIRRRERFCPRRTAAAVAYTIPRNLGSNILILRNKYGLPDYRQMQRTSDEST